jgi:ADP-ribose pyrophosphatase YjhB (NUDIX family)
VNYLQAQLDDMEGLFGRPDVVSKAQSMRPEELEVVRASMKDGRAHDITLYIEKDDGFIFIAKPFYPPGLYRAPSGGVKPGESFLDGARREAHEETGVSIELLKYFLRINVTFHSSSDSLDWVSHIFTARYTGGEIEPLDKAEIREARVVGRDEIPEMQEMMRNSGSSGLVYRAYLTEESLKRL